MEGGRKGGGREGGREEGRREGRREGGSEEGGRKGGREGRAVVGLGRGRENEGNIHMNTHAVKAAENIQCSSSHSLIAGLVHCTELTLHTAACSNGRPAPCLRPLPAPTGSSAGTHRTHNMEQKKGSHAQQDYLRCSEG